MPSQSSLDGESTPDHWIVTSSPDLGIVLGVTEIETLQWDNSGIRIKNRNRIIDLGFSDNIIFLDGFGFFLFFLFFWVSERELGKDMPASEWRVGAEEEDGPWGAFFVL